MEMNAVCNHFGIGFRSEHVAQAFQIGAQCLVILDDPVVHDGHAVARDVRVGVVRGRNAMGGPSGMRDADVAADRSRVECVLENLHLADGPQTGDPATLEHGDARRIIAAVFQATQSLHEDGNRVALRNDTHDSTHVRLAPAAEKGCLVCPTRTGSPAPAYARHYCKLIDTGPYRRVTAGAADMDVMDRPALGTMRPYRHSEARAAALRESASV